MTTKKTTTFLLLERKYDIWETLLSLLPPYLVLLIFYPSVVGMFFNFHLVEMEEPFILLAFIFPLLILRHVTSRNIFYYLILIYVFIDGFIDSLHWIILKSPLTANSIFVGLSTNYQEAAGFLLFKKGYGLLFIIPYLLLFILAMKYTFKTSKSKLNFDLRIALAILFAGVFFLGVRYYQGGFRYASPLLARSSFLFYKDIRNFKKLQKERQWEGKELAATLQSPQTKRIVVLIEGESTNRNHMSLYGFGRDTNPRLSKAKDIFIYDDVISGYANTMNSITGSLTEANIENQLKTYECFSIFDICRSAGVKTYWLSNQSALSFLDNIITLLARQTDKQEFLNLTTGLSISRKETPSYDSVLFEALHRALDEEGDQKFIVLHLLGSHLLYSQRYPKEFTRFIPKSEEKKEKVIADYHNSLYFNDFVVDSILNILRNYSEKNQIPIAAVYTSDHGQNVYDDAPYAGHEYADTVYNSIVEIPYIVWLSEQYKTHFSERSNEIASNTGKSYMTDDHFHSLIDLLNINTPVLDKSRSLFNPDYFENHTRILIDGRIYDKKSKQIETSH